MTPEIQKYIEVLESQVGYSERSGSHTKFGKWYGKHVEFDADYGSAPWCDMYLSWAAHKLGYQDWIGQFAWTVAHAKWFRKEGAWGKKPQVGAFVFYDWSGTDRLGGIDHVGIVTRVEGGRIFTIEGNIDGGVVKRKERDTSKVVGYGYPQRIKKRLDRAEARKQAEKQASEPGQVEGQTPEEAQGQSTHPASTPQSVHPQAEPQSGPQSEPQTVQPQAVQARAPLPSVPDSAGHKTPDSPPASDSAKQTPQAVVAPSVKGKHAKPVTADTEEATTRPLPAHDDASATGPLPAIDSPTLVGTTLVAALAVLAVAKTRRLRLTLATATAGKLSPRPKGRRRRTTAAPVTAVKRRTLAVRTVGLRELQESAERLATSAALASLMASDVPHRHRAAGTHREITGSRHESTGAHRHATSRHATGSHRRAANPHRNASDASRHAPDALHHTTDALHHAPDAHRHPKGRRSTHATPYTSSFDADPYEPDFDRDRFTFTDQTGPIQAVPLQVVIDAGMFGHVVVPDATTPFDAFSPPTRHGDILETQDAAYRGRRRRHPAEEPPTFSPDLPPQGRRHRRRAADAHRHRSEDLLAGAGGGRHRA